MRELKQHRRYFEPLYKGIKPFDVRRDEGFKEGEDVLYREWDDLMGNYTGRSMCCTITYIYRGTKQYGLAPGYCVLGLKYKGR